jgi:hypothetical protein
MAAGESYEPCMGRWSRGIATPFLDWLDETRRVLRPGGMAGFYVWDYSGRGLGFLAAFWDAAAALDPAAGDLAEHRRFPFCTPGGLEELGPGWGPLHRHRDRDGVRGFRRLLAPVHSPGQRRAIAPASILRRASAFGRGWRKPCRGGPTAPSR